MNPLRMADKYGNGDILDELLHVLANRRRRIIVRFLADHDSGKLMDIAELIAELNTNESTQRNVYVTLYQTHAPKMDRANVVIYDQQNKSISRGSQFQHCYEIL